MLPHMLTLDFKNLGRHLHRILVPSSVSHHQAHTM